MTNFNQLKTHIMNLQELKKNQLSKEELKAIKAGVAPDCEPGETLVKDPIYGPICVPLGGCNWP